MRILTWNLCTTFAALGAAIAYGILLLLFGFHLVYLPGALLGLLAAYGVSSALGAALIRIGAGQRLIAALILGAACGLITLIAGAFALGVGFFATETARQISSAPSGQSLWNRLAEFAPHNATDFIVEPVLAGTLFGAIPALTLGLVFGGVLHARTAKSSVPTPPIKAWTFGGAVLVAAVPAVLWTSMTASITGTADRYAALPMAIGACGQTIAGKGVLAYCKGFPCAEGRCDFDEAHDAFAIYVEPPPGAGWSWAGGGLGTTRRADEIGHHMYWVRRNPGGFMDENSPRRHQSFTLQFDGDQIVVGDHWFRFQPGMLFSVMYAEDWSYTVLHGADAQREGRLSVIALQQVLDDACADSPACEQAFQLRVRED